jgi:hypothetical protein
VAKAAGFNNSFNSGELSPDAAERVDLQQFAQGMALGLNLVGLVTGPAARSPGTWLAGLTKLQTLAGAVVLIPFCRDPADAQVIELGASYFRVWYADGTPVMSGGSPLEVAHGWSQADLPRLSWDQNGDVVIVTHRDGLRQRVIRRLSPTSWEIDDYGFKSGPWRPENTNRGFTLTITGTSTGCTEDPLIGSIAEGQTVTLTASAALFNANHVGGLWRLRQNDGAPGSETWATRTEYDVGQFVLSDGKIYKRNSGGPQPGTASSGLTPPIHESGVVSDGRWNWEFMNDGAGVVEITSFTSSTVAVGTVRRPGPLKTGQATSYWSEGAWSPYRGFPTAKPAFREERLVFAGAPGDPDKFDLTRTAGFDEEEADFLPGLGTGRVVDTEAVRRFAGDEPGRVVWAMSLPSLILGTTRQEVLVTGATSEDPLAPSSTRAVALTGFGSADVSPVKAHDAVLYVQRGRKTLRELRYGYDQGTGSRDLSVVASHIGERRFAQLAWQGSENLCWCRLEDGGLAALVYHVEQQVYGFTRRVLAAGTADEGDPDSAGDWTVESIAVLPGTEDRLWIAARRAKGGGYQRAILRLATRDEGNFYDLAERYEGTAVGTVSGLDHLEGETVSALADGAEYRGLTVTDGEVTLPDDLTATSILVGLPYMSRFRSLPLDLGGGGSGLGSRSRVTEAVIVIEGVECLAGVEDQPRLEKVSSRLRNEVDAPVARRHAAKCIFSGQTSREVQIVVETDCGWDLKIKAIKPVGVTNA